MLQLIKRDFQLFFFTGLSDYQLFTNQSKVKVVNSLNKFKNKSF